ncbi:NAD(P)/FAD-dependent oxidoreductase [Brevibacillus borstelensis]|uniref:NAD(P)/FAD-dependent oxidoreductase n=1 Tax=Brevibacillus borstelensis TaxID=45462 RepID=UPI0014907C0E|nr:NAD(P)/FAD-dependent oxidoreductase [Brevibacillus borstelensis]MCC0567373.1 NAD(P)/FAD-dependent oxidoreductase [Brevibacillus borstelensis]MCM3473583.1 NAD(P)/FAD-dependent oxidoreductase [Brevibacillus borstelensis]MCM3561841.1 NAD(P)/FAD-dependent oxidoreductase [Brevibacillus borstelensis]MCM3593922.1 NAD(P)/FAD-dependent oxidoreductase [Brevibacillus borstelensis]MED1745828.1 NAD(P)/FAD-dependent oxidoreductase [Brevibacillus borstelensis]
MEHVQVLIAGGGIAGMSAAIWCERLGLSCILIEKTDRLGGQLAQIHNEIWDFPPHIYADGTNLLEELQSHKVLRSLQVRFGEALTSVDPTKRKVTTTRTAYQTDYLIVATGVSPNQIPALADCSKVLAPWFSTTAEAEAVTGMDIAVIGGGDRAAESAYNLSRYARTVHLLVRSAHMRARSQWRERLSTLPSLTILWETEVAACSERDGKAVLSLRSFRPDTPSTISVDRILPRIGVHGNVDGLDSLLGEENSRYLPADNYQLVKGTEWIYAIGDVTNGADYGSLSLAAGQAMKAVKHISLQLKEQ